jgi:hypothetical protein
MAGGIADTFLDLSLEPIASCPIIPIWQRSHDKIHNFANVRPCPEIEKGIGWTALFS